MMAPTALLLALFFFYPLLNAAYLSLYQWDLLTPPKYVGLDNYAALSQSGELMHAFTTTLAFSVVVDDSPRARRLIEELNEAFEVRYNDGCELITVRHYDEATLQQLTKGKAVMLEQRSRSTARFVVK